MRITLDDALVAQYDRHAQDATQPVETVIARQLARFASVPPQVRAVILLPDQLQQLEQLLGGGSLKSAQDLVTRVKTYASITIGNITLDLTPAEKAEIAHRAQKQGKSPAVIIKDLVNQIRDQLFWGTTPVR